MFNYILTLSKANSPSSPQHCVRYKNKKIWLISCHSHIALRLNCNQNYFPRKVIYLKLLNAINTPCFVSNFSVVRWFDDIQIMFRSFHF